MMLVRVGNPAALQTQYDVYGSIILATAHPWGLRGRERVHTFPAMMSSADCDRLSRIAHRLGLPDRKRHWGGVAGGRRELILQRPCNENRGAFVTSFDDDDLDASVLPMPELGLLRHRNSVGLLSEDIAPVTGEQWRGFPQTCSPAGVINSELRLSRTWEATP